MNGLKNMLSFLNFSQYPKQEKPRRIVYLIGCSKEEILKRGFLKFIGGFVAFCFTVTSILPPAQAQVLGTPEVSLSRADFKIPAELGEIKQIIPSGTEKILIHIQTAHGHFEAEENIQKILAYLKTHYQLNQLFLEGASHRLQPDLFRLFPQDPQLNQSVLKRLMERGELTGAESFLVGDPDAQGWGMEDFESYHENWMDFRAVYAAAGENQKIVDAMHRHLGKLMSVYFSKDLQDFYRSFKAFEEERSSLETWLTALKKAAFKHLRLDLEDPFSQQSWPYLVRFFKLQRAAQKIEPEKLQEEKNILLEEISKSGISPDLQKQLASLLSGSESFLSNHDGFPGRDARHLLEQIFSALPPDYPFEKFTQLKYYFQHLVFRQELQSEGFFQEIQRLQNSLFAGLAEQKREQDLLEILKTASLFEKMIRLKLTREEYSLVQKDPNNYLPNELFKKIDDFGPSSLNFAAIEPMAKRALHFYEGAVHRESAMMSSVLSQLSRRKKEKAVLITGGFHAEGLKQAAAQKGFTTIEILPRIHELEKSSEAVYLRSLLGTEAVKQSHLEHALRTDPAHIVAMGEPFAAHVRSELREVIESVVRDEKKSSSDSALRDSNLPALLAAFSSRSELHSAQRLNTLMPLPKEGLPAGQAGGRAELRQDPVNAQAMHIVTKATTLKVGDVLVINQNGAGDQHFLITQINAGAQSAAVVQHIQDVTAIRADDEDPAEMTFDRADILGVEYLPAARSELRIDVANAHDRLQSKEKQVLAEQLSRGFNDALQTHQGQKQLLDFGAGDGEILAAVAPLFTRSIAIDKDPKRLRRVEAINVRGIETLSADFMQAVDRFNGQKFDGIVLSHSLLFIPFAQRDAFLQKVLKLLSQNGRAAIVLNSNQPRQGNQAHMRAQLMRHHDFVPKGTKTNLETRIGEWGYDVQVEPVHIVHETDTREEMIQLVAAILPARDREQRQARQNITHYVDQNLKIKDRPGYRLEIDEEILWVSLRSELRADTVEFPAIAPSLLALGNGDLFVPKSVEAVQKGAGVIHFDVIGGNGQETAIVKARGAKDTTGIFTPQKLLEIKQAGQAHGLQIPVDVHLMVMAPTEAYLRSFIDQGADFISIHWEGYDDKNVLRDRLRFIRSHGVKNGLAVNPDVNIDEVMAFLKETKVDMVLQMSVFPGLGGQKFMPAVLDNVKKLKASGFEGLVEIDGGITKDTIQPAAQAGVDIFVAGSSVFGASDLGQAIGQLKTGAQKAKILEYLTNQLQSAQESFVRGIQTGLLQNFTDRTHQFLEKLEFLKSQEFFQRVEINTLYQELNTFIGEIGYLLGEKKLQGGVDLWHVRQAEQRLQITARLLHGIPSGSDQVQFQAIFNILQAASFLLDAEWAHHRLGADETFSDHIRTILNYFVEGVRIEPPIFEITNMEKIVSAREAISVLVQNLIRRERKQPSRYTDVRTELGKAHARLAKVTRSELRQKKDSRWWKDSSKTYFAQSVPISALRRPDDSGHGKFTYLPEYAAQAIQDGINVTLLLPFFAAGNESPFAPVSTYALNELMIDWSEIEDVRAQPELQDLLRASAGKQSRIDYADVRARETEVALAAANRFEAFGDADRKKAFAAFYEQHSFWLQDYAEFMAMRDLLKKPSDQWSPEEQAVTQKDSLFHKLVFKHQYAQWIAYEQFQTALTEAQKTGMKFIFIMPMFRGKDSVDVWRHGEKYFRDVKNPERYPGVVHGKTNERWKELALWDWTNLGREHFEFILDPYSHWLDFGLDGSWIDYLHGAYHYPVRNLQPHEPGQLKSGDEPGDAFTLRLSSVIRSRGAIPLAEVFYEMNGTARTNGFVTIDGNWRRASTHDTNRMTAVDLIEAVRRHAAGLAQDGEESAKFIGITLGDLHGDPENIKVLKDGHSYWRYRIPLPGDPDYQRRHPYNLAPYFRHYFQSAGKPSSTDVWQDPGLILSALQAAADSFVKHIADENFPGGERVELWAASRDWFFEQWGRDTFIAFSGLLLSTGRFDEAKNVIRSLARLEKNGLIPNRIPQGKPIEYNTVDGSLWFIDAIKKYWQVTKDDDFVREMLPVIRKIIEGYRQGTGDEPFRAYHPIQMDPSDGLIRAPAQATWMDAQLGSQAFTPRNGKPVEINALWYAGLRFLAELETRFGTPERQTEVSQLASQVRQSFNQKFWNPSAETDPNAAPLFDVIEGDPHKAALRPNMLFAVSHGGDLLALDRQKAVVRAAEKWLLTPYGLRTLSPLDSHYHTEYHTEWPQAQKDPAYHQGTVWPWLIGTYIDSLVRIRQFDELPEAEIQNEVRMLLTPLLEFLITSPVGSLPEVFDAEKRQDGIRHPGGTSSQAWSVAEVLRTLTEHGGVSPARSELRPVPVELNTAPSRDAEARSELRPAQWPGTVPFRGNVPRSELRQLNGTARTISLRKLFQDVLFEREKSYSAVQKWPKAVAVLGGARISEGHPYYQLGEEVGKVLLKYGIPPRTGAGPGMMEAPLKTYSKMRKALIFAKTIRGIIILGFGAWLFILGLPIHVFLGAGLAAVWTIPAVLWAVLKLKIPPPGQGIRIQLSFEQATNPYVEIVERFNRFITRKEALYVNTYGAIFLPGGFGTLDELFEFWRRGVPVVLVGKAFWDPIVKKFEESLEKEKILDQLDSRTPSRIQVTDDPEEAVQYLLAASETSRPSYLKNGRDQLNAELERGLNRLHRDSDQSVVFTGKPKIENGNIKLAEKIANVIARETGVNIRVASTGPLLSRLLDQARQNSWSQKFEAVLYAPSDNPDITGQIASLSLGDSLMTVQSESNHQILSAFHAYAYVFLPGAVGTMNKLMDVLTIIQTKKIRAKPILLVGRSFWEPLLVQLRQTMFERPDGLHLIGEKDLDLVRIVDEENLNAELARLTEDLRFKVFEEYVEDSQLRGIKSLSLSLLLKTANLGMLNASSEIFIRRVQKAIRILNAYGYYLNPNSIDPSHGDAGYYELDLSRRKRELQTAARSELRNIETAPESSQRLASRRDRLALVVALARSLGHLNITDRIIDLQASVRKIFRTEEENGSNPAVNLPGDLGNILSVLTGLLFMEREKLFPNYKMLNQEASEIPVSEFNNFQADYLDWLTKLQGAVLMIRDETDQLPKVPETQQQKFSEMQTLIDRFILDLQAWLDLISETKSRDLKNIALGPWLQSRHWESDIELNPKLVLEDNLPEIEVPEALLHHALERIISNAAKKKAPVTITVKPAADGKGQPAVAIEISNPGMLREEWRMKKDGVASILLRDFNASRKPGGRLRKRKEGIPFAYLAVQKMGGDMSVTSANGTVQFTVTLPAGVRSELRNDLAGEAILAEPGEEILLTLAEGASAEQQIQNLTFPEKRPVSLSVFASSAEQMSELEGIGFDPIDIRQDVTETVMAAFEQGVVKAVKELPLKNQFKLIFHHPIEIVPGVSAAELTLVYEGQDQFKGMSQKVLEFLRGVDRRHPQSLREYLSQGKLQPAIGLYGIVRPQVRDELSILFDWDQEMLLTQAEQAERIRAAETERIKQTQAATNDRYSEETLEPRPLPMPVAQLLEEVRHLDRHWLFHNGHMISEGLRSIESIIGGALRKSGMVRKNLNQQYQEMHREFHGITAEIQHQIEAGNILEFSVFSRINERLTNLYDQVSRYAVALSSAGHSLVLFQRDRLRPFTLEEAASLNQTLAFYTLVEILRRYFITLASQTDMTVDARKLFKDVAHEGKLDPVRATDPADELSPRVMQALEQIQSNLRQVRNGYPANAFPLTSATLGHLYDDLIGEITEIQNTGDLEKMQWLARRFLFHLSTVMSVTRDLPWYEAGTVLPLTFNRLVFHDSIAASRELFQFLGLADADLDIFFNNNRPSAFDLVDPAVLKSVPPELLPSNLRPRSELRAASASEADTRNLIFGIIQGQAVRGQDDAMKQTLLTLIPLPILEKIKQKSSSWAFKTHLTPDEILKIQNNEIVFHAVHPGAGQISFVAWGHQAERLFEIHLSANGGTLEIGNHGFLSGFQQKARQEFKQSRHPQFEWWFRKNLVPFAQKLGFQEIGIHPSNLEEDFLRDLGFESTAERGYMTADLSRVRSELRNSSQRQTAFQHWMHRKSELPKLLPPKVQEVLKTNNIPEAVNQAASGLAGEISAQEKLFSYVFLALYFIQNQRFDTGRTYLEKAREFFFSQSSEDKDFPPLSDLLLNLTTDLLMEQVRSEEPNRALVDYLTDFGRNLADEFEYFIDPKYIRKFSEWSKRLEPGRETPGAAPQNDSSPEAISAVRPLSETGHTVLEGSLIAAFGELPQENLWQSRNAVFLRADRQALPGKTVQQAEIVFLDVTAFWRGKNQNANGKKTEESDYFLYALRVLKQASAARTIVLYNSDNHESILNGAADYLKREIPSLITKAVFVNIPQNLELPESRRSIGVKSERGRFIFDFNLEALEREEDQKFVNAIEGLSHENSGDVKILRALQIAALVIPEGELEVLSTEEGQALKTFQELDQSALTHAGLKEQLHLLFAAPDGKFKFPGAVRLLRRYALEKIETPLSNIPYLKDDGQTLILHEAYAEALASNREWAFRYLLNPEESREAIEEEIREEMKRTAQLNGDGWQYKDKEDLRVKIALTMLEPLVEAGFGDDLLLEIKEKKTQFPEKTADLNRAEYEIKKFMKQYGSLSKEPEPQPEVTPAIAAPAPAAGPVKPSTAEMKFPASWTDAVGSTDVLKAALERSARNGQVKKVAPTLSRIQRAFEHSKSARRSFWGRGSFLNFITPLIGPEWAQNFAEQFEFPSDSYDFSAVSDPVSEDPLPSREGFDPAHDGIYVIRDAVYWPVDLDRTMQALHEIQQDIAANSDLTSVEILWEAALGLENVKKGFRDLNIIATRGDRNKERALKVLSNQQIQAFKQFYPRWQKAENDLGALRELLKNPDQEILAGFDAYAAVYNNMSGVSGAEDNLSETVYFNQFMAKHGMTGRQFIASSRALRKYLYDQVMKHLTDQAVRQGDFEKAAGFLNAAVEDTKNHDSSFVEEAVSRKRKNKKTAIIFLRSSRSGEDVEALRQNGYRVLYYQQTTPEAQPPYEALIHQAFQENPDETETRRLDGYFLMFLYLLQEVRSRVANNTAKAYAVTNRILEGRDLKTGESLGLPALTAGEMEAAIKKVGEAVSANPETPTLGPILEWLESTGRWAEQYTDFLKAKHWPAKHLKLRFERMDDLVVAEDLGSAARSELRETGQSLKELGTKIRSFLTFPNAVRLEAVLKAIAPFVHSIEGHTHDLNDVMKQRHDALGGYDQGILLSSVVYPDGSSYRAEKPELVRDNYTQSITKTGENGRVSEISSAKGNYADLMEAYPRFIHAQLAFLTEAAENPGDIRFEELYPRLADLLAALQHFPKVALTGEISTLEVVSLLEKYGYYRGVFKYNGKKSPIVALKPDPARPLIILIEKQGDTLILRRTTLNNLKTLLDFTSPVPSGMLDVTALFRKVPAEEQMGYFYRKSADILEAIQKKILKGKTFEEIKGELETAIGGKASSEKPVSRSELREVQSSEVKSKTLKIGATLRLSIPNAPGQPAEYVSLQLLRIQANHRGSLDAVFDIASSRYILKNRWTIWQRKVGEMTDAEGNWVLSRVREAAQREKPKLINFAIEPSQSFVFFNVKPFFENRDVEFLQDWQVYVESVDEEAGEVELTIHHDTRPNPFFKLETKEPAASVVPEPAAISLKNFEAVKPMQTYLQRRGITEDGLIKVAVVVLDGILPESLKEWADKILIIFYQGNFTAANETAVKSVEKMFQISDPALLDAFVLGSDFALNQGGLEAIRALFPYVPVVVFDPSGRNAALIEKKMAEIQVVESVEELHQVRSELRAKNPRRIGQTVSITTSEELSVTALLKQIVDDVMIMTPRLMQNFKSLLPEAVRGLMQDLAALVEISKNA